MKTFCQYIVEVQNINEIHHNTTAGTLKRIAKNGHRMSHISRARYVIDHQNHLHAGNSYEHTHHDIHPAMNEHRITGEVIHNHKTNQTWHQVYTGHAHVDKNEHIKALEASGVKRRE